jgi:hypothetical protein
MRLSRLEGGLCARLSRSFLRFSATDAVQQHRDGTPRNREADRSKIQPMNRFEKAIGGLGGVRVGWVVGGLGWRCKEVGLRMGRRRGFSCGERAGAKAIR